MHYKNGRLAKVGDKVIGITYNVKGMVAGTLLSITPGPDACSALVGFSETYFPNADGKFIPRHEGTLVKLQGTSHHGNDGDMAATYYKQDFTHCSNLLHVDDVASLLEWIPEMAGYELYQKRVVIEKAELDNKISKLNSFCESTTFTELSDKDKSLLLEQLGYMNNYTNTLDDRIRLFGRKEQT